jgi:glyoxylase-like metal-dependent hydrolase (beta-lactamase superfamily II)
VNTKDWNSSVVSDFASIPVTKDYSHATTARQMVYVVFNKNYKQAASARVASIYYLTPQSISDGTPSFDVPEMSYLLKDKGVDPVSGKGFVTIRHPYPESDPYTRSTEPFEIIKNTFYYVGDNEVAVYLFHADNGTPNNKTDDRLIMLDSGWPMSGYQYWKNIEAMGYDPRKITDIMLTHGHFDHYGSTVELITMIENSGGKVSLRGTKEDTFGITRDVLGNSWNIKGALPDVEKVIRAKTIAYEYDKFYNFGNVQILVTPTPGHTSGTGSFVFKIKRPENGEWVSFGYMGGYGFNGMYTPSAGNGYLRLNFQLGLAWLQQMVDVDYVAPQHTNQYPIIEVYQALKAYNNDPVNKGKQLTMMDALTRNEFVNFCEKRYSVVTNRLSDEKDKRYKSLETSGPFKPGRENGLNQVKATLLDGGKIIRGFDGFQNKNPKIPLLKDGIQIVTDSYVNDPDGWYVQFYIDVLDDYKGFLPDNYTYAGVYTDKDFYGIFKVGGPVESLRPAQGAPEILRTQRLNSKEEAEKVLKSVRKGGSYYISLTKASAIIVPADVTKTFIP